MAARCTTPAAAMHHSAVRRFQRAYGLSADGIVGSDTKACLYMALSEVIPTSCVYVDPSIHSDDLPAWN